MKTFSTRQALSLLSALGALALLTLPATATAQGRKLPRRPQSRPPRPAQNSMIPASFSNADIDIPEKSASAKTATQQEVVDAVLASTLRQLWGQTDEHWHQGEYNHIVNLYRIIAQGDPKNINAYGNAAWLLWSTDRSDEALAFLKQGLAANPDGFAMYDEVGSHYFIHLHQPQPALPYYEKAVTFKCPYSTWHMLAQCYERTNQWDKAVGAWESATKYVDDPLAPQRLKRARAELARRNGSKQ